MENRLCKKCGKMEKLAIKRAKEEYEHMQIAKFMPENICQHCNMSFRKAKMLATHQCGKLSCSNCGLKFVATRKFDRNNFRKKKCLCGKCWKEYQVHKNIWASYKPNPNIEYEDDE